MSRCWPDLLAPAADVQVTTTVQRGKMDLGAVMRARRRRRSVTWLSAATAADAVGMLLAALSVQFVLDGLANAGLSG